MRSPELVAEKVEFNITPSMDYANSIVSPYPARGRGRKGNDDGTTTTQGETTDNAAGTSKDTEDDGFQAQKPKNARGRGRGRGRASFGRGIGANVSQTGSGSGSG